MRVSDNVYTSLRRYADVKSALASTLAVFPNDYGDADMAGVRGIRRKKPTPGRCIKCSIQFEPQIPLRCRDISESWLLVCALAERDATAAKTALDAHGEDPIAWAMRFSLVAHS